MKHRHRSQAISSFYFFVNYHLKGKYKYRNIKTNTQTQIHKYEYTYRKTHSKRVKSVKSCKWSLTHWPTFTSRESVLRVTSCNAKNEKIGSSSNHLSRINPSSASPRSWDIFSSFRNIHSDYFLKLRATEDEYLWCLTCSDVSVFPDRAPGALPCSFLPR